MNSQSANDLKGDTNLMDNEKVVRTITASMFLRKTVRKILNACKQEFQGRFDYTESWHLIESDFILSGNKKTVDMVINGMNNSFEKAISNAKT